MKKLYPLMAKLEGQKILIVGGGTVATRKVRSLLGTGARIRVVSPDVSPEIAALAGKQKIMTELRPFSSGDLSGHTLVFAATDDPNLNDRISEAAIQRNIPVNNVSNPAKCTFFVPSRVVRGDLILAISTSGKSPATAKWLRKQLNKTFGPEYEMLLKWMGLLRRTLDEMGVSPRQVSRLSESLLNGGILERLADRDTEGTRAMLEKAFQTILKIPVPQSLMKRLGA